MFFPRNPPPRFFVLALLFFSSSICLGVDDPPDAEKILDRYAEALGGKAAFERIKTRITKSIMMMEKLGVKGTITRYQARPGLSFELTEIQGLGPMKDATNGRTVWEISATRGPSLKQGEEKALSLREAYLDKEVRWREFFEKVECAGAEEVEGRPCYKVVMTPKTGQPEIRYFDQETGLLAKHEQKVKGPTGEIAMTHLPGDYKKVDGVPIPHKVTSKLMGMEVVVTIESVKHNVELPEGCFDPPNEVKALVEEEEKKEACRLNVESFEAIWGTVRDVHWDRSFGGMDWQAIHDEFKPRVQEASTREEARAVMQEALDRLGLTHFSIHPEEAEKKNGDGVTGLDIRVLDGRAAVVSVGSRPAALGIRPGWLIGKINGSEPDLEAIDGRYEDSPLKPIMLRKAVMSKLRGAINGTVQIEFLNGSDEPVVMEVPLAEPEGVEYRFGHLPVQYVRFEARELESGIGYIAFNCFSDPAGLMKRFEEAMHGFHGCLGMIIDVRGNPGGKQSMAVGMAGWFVTEKDLSLGTTICRDGIRRSALNPRRNAFTKPLAVLIDGCTGSSAEIFSGGLKDLGRARLFGTRTAGAVLPSVFCKLPNDDVFQYATGDYVTCKGNRLEGIGVAPDVEVALTRKALLQGRDPALEAAEQWIEMCDAPERCETN